MERSNRVAVSLVALLVLVGAIVTLLAATEAIASDFLPGGPAEDPTDAWFYHQLKGLADFDGDAQAITIAVAVVVAIATLVVLFIEVRPIIRRRGTLEISLTPQGILTVDANSVQLLAERTGISNRNVSSLRCRLRVRRRRSVAGPASISIACYPRLVLGSNVQEVGDDLQTRIKEVVQDLTGLAVLQVNVVRVRFDRSDNSRLIGS